MNPTYFYSFLLACHLGRPPVFNQTLHVTSVTGEGLPFGIQQEISSRLNQSFLQRGSGELLGVAVTILSLEERPVLLGEVAQAFEISVTLYIEVASGASFVVSGFDQYTKRSDLTAFGGADRDGAWSRLLDHLGAKILAEIGKNHVSIQLDSGFVEVAYGKTLSVAQEPIMEGER